MSKIPQIAFCYLYVVINKNQEFKFIIGKWKVEILFEADFLFLRSYIFKIFTLSHQ